MAGLKVFYFVWIGCLFLLWNACALLDSSGATRSVRYPNRVNSEMRQTFSVAEADFTEKKYASAFKKYQDYLKAYPYNQLSDQAAFRLGQIHMLQKKYQAAVDQFAKLINKTPDPKVKSKSNVKAGISAYRLNNYSKAVYYFSAVDANALDIKDKAKAFGLSVYARSSLQQGVDDLAFDLAALLDSYVGLSAEQIKQEFGDEAPNKAFVLNKLEEWAKKSSPANKLDRRFSSYQYKSKPSEPFILFKLGKVYQASDPGQAKKYLKQYLNKYGNGSFAAEADKMLTSLGGSSFSLSFGKKPLSIGVILPLTGKYGNFGQNTLKGMECAAGVKVECQGVKNIRLIQRDDAGEPEQAVKAIEELFHQQRVSIVLGPLLSNVSGSVAKRAEEIGVVMLSLAQKSGVANTGSHVYSLGLTPTTQVQALLKYISEKRRVKNLGVFYPNNNYGNEFSKQASKLAPNYNVKIVAKVSFSPDATDLAGVLDQLPKDLEALFIPDSFNTVIRISGELELHGLNKAILLGTNAWNDERLARDVNPSLRDLVFVDSFFNGSQNQEVQGFVGQYKNAFGQTPTTLEAMGYDALRFVSIALKGKKVKDQEEVRRAIMGFRGFKGVTGLRGFKSDRTALMEPYLLTVKDGKVREL